jgi:2-deoxy-D-gluconate 3-dehydrogenase
MTLDQFSLAGKKALVTGASRGIGQVIAAAFAQAGADVAISARGAHGLATTAAQVRDLGREAIEIPADLTTQHAAADVVTAAIERLGHLDIVVNNAGGSNFVVPFLDMRLSGWEKVLRLNLDATVSLTKTLATEWGRTGVRVNALCPGWTATELNRMLWETPDGGQATIANVPMGRWARPEEMGGPAVFLASDASSFMTGQVLAIDGGLTVNAA